MISKWRAGRIKFAFLEVSFPDDEEDELEMTNTIKWNINVHQSISYSVDVADVAVAVSV